MFFPASAARTLRFIIDFGQVLGRVVQHRGPLEDRVAAVGLDHVLEAGQRLFDALLLARGQLLAPQSTGTPASAASSRWR